MSVADRMVVRTGSGAYKSLPRRTALGLIAAGRAQIATEPEHAQAPLTPADEPHTPVVPETPDSPPTPQEHTQTPAPEVFVGTPDEVDALMDALAPVGDAEPDYIPAEMPARELPPEPKSTARRAEWADYADSLGVEVTSAMTKTQIQVAAQEAAQSLSNLPQPALTGGRLETPEDEPAAETVADDPDTRTR